jgi:hypothetical protein
MDLALQTLPEGRREELCAIAVVVTAETGSVEDFGRRGPPSRFFHASLIKCKCRPWNPI